jgi:hypothetical protein
VPDDLLHTLIELTAFAVVALLDASALAMLLAPCSKP